MKPYIVEEGGIMEKELLKEKLRGKVVGNAESDADERLATQEREGGFEEQNVYGEQTREALVEADGLKASEQGFMEGYEATAQDDQQISPNQEKIIQQRLTLITNKINDEKKIEVE